MVLCERKNLDMEKKIIRNYKNKFDEIRQEEDLKKLKNDCLKIFMNVE